MSEPQKPDLHRYRVGNPGWEYEQAKGQPYESHADADLRDLLFAVMRSADCLWEELRAIRHVLETGESIGAARQNAAKASGNAGSIEHEKRS